MFQIKDLKNKSGTQMNFNYRKLYSNVDSDKEIYKIDRFGFLRSYIEEETGEDMFYKHEWYKLIDIYQTDRCTFKEAILKNGYLKNGIPIALKPRIWRLLLFQPKKMNSVECLETRISKILKVGVHFVRRSNRTNNKSRYNNLISYESIFEPQIHVDVQRTFKEHYLFNKKFGKGQSELFYILVAFSNAHKNIGYCQGLNEIAAVLLMYFTEQEAFEALEVLIIKNKIGEMFNSTLRLFPRIDKIQRRLFKILIPELLKHIEKNCENFHIYLIEWYMTFYCRFDIKLVLRIWDLLIFFGFEILFYISAAILQFHQITIMECCEESLPLFLNNIKNMKIDENNIINTVFEYMRNLNLSNIKL